MVHTGDCSMGMARSRPASREQAAQALTQGWRRGRLPGRLRAGDAGSLSRPSARGPAARPQVGQRRAGRFLGAGAV
ncbi:DUF6233 domain-containing protein [Streptomyces virginiae]|uniref:DUF6233 domain-containing protein n=1 Tax=Streptomyces virginiae TaxID=1961 RepID=UPI00363B1F4A